MCTACDPARHLDGAAADACRCGAPETLRTLARIEADLSRREMLGGAEALLAMFAGFGLAAPADARTGPATQPLLLTNLRLFDGREPRLRDDVDVLVEGRRIAALPPRAQGPADAEWIDCAGRTLMPGLIDAHWHATLAAAPELTVFTDDFAYVHLLAAREAGATLERGFTTVRDTGGPAFALKRAIDAGVVAGPRLFPSGAMVSQTSGHGDFRFPNQLPRVAGEPLDHVQQVGISALADGVDAVLVRVREQLMKGASQIKMMAGGGVSSLFDPIDSIQYLEEELAAGVRAAADWGTYVCVHVYIPGGMRRALRAGVRCIEHGQLTDEETVRMMAGEGVWWSLQPFLADEDANPKPDPAQRAQQERIAAGTPQAYEWAQKHGVRTAFGTDILLNPKGPAAQGRQLAKLARFMDPLAALKTATGDAGELLALSGERAPYDGPLGVVAPGALADLLVVDGELETDLSALADPATTLRLIMKDGRIAKRAF
jgi:imidazolonepropionase-like amidohydrolase